MNKWLATLFCSLSFPTWAAVDLSPFFNRITFTLSAQQWVATKTALVSVSIHAAVADKSAEDAQNQAQALLKKLSNQVDWRFVAFDRQVDQSGLENLQITAEARLQPNELAGLRSKARALSKPGMNLTIAAIQFIPSDQEIEQANAALRQQIYQAAKNEIATLNQTYSNQTYYLNQINFYDTPELPIRTMQMNAVMQKNNVNTTTPTLSVGNKIELKATVVAASFSKALSQLPATTKSGAQE